MRLRIAAIALLFALLLPARAQSKEAEAGQLILWLLDEDRDLNGIPFADIIHATSGKRIIPLNRTNAADRALLAKIGTAMDRVLARMNATNSPAQKERRINEVSRHFEEAMRQELDAVAGFKCAWPVTAAGAAQRSGYPDLRLVDEASGRVVYLDPKLFEAKSRGSSLRTFYFTPRKETNKVLDDAHHLIVGIAHDGGGQNERGFVRWELVDLARFRVRLKAEFQASNRDLYQEEAVVGRSAEKNQKQETP
jgi:hypothetical protein